VTRVVCILVDSRDPYPFLRVRLGDLDDRLRVAFQQGVANLSGGDGADVLAAPHGDTYLYGDRGHDVLRGYHCNGGDDADFLDGCTGVARGNAGNDTLIGTPGTDSMHGGAGADLIRGGPGNDFLYGNSGNDVIYGNSGNDRISGGPGKDKTFGGPGNDTITS
jgi:Ca2+-binding RTX toxin-like protein